MIEVKKAYCPLCKNEMTEEEDETVWRCNNEDCPVKYVQIMDENNDQICQVAIDD